MKNLFLTLLITLLSTSTFAKGGDNDWIDHNTLLFRTKAYHQIFVFMSNKSDTLALEKNALQFSQFLEAQKTTVNSFTKKRFFSNGVESQRFCITAATLPKNQSQKLYLKSLIKEELASFSSQMQVIILSDLKTPCD